MAAPVCARCEFPFDGRYGFGVAWIAGDLLLCIWCARRAGLLEQRAPVRKRRRR